MHSAIFAPVIALVLWTFVMWGWLYTTRIPALSRHGIVYDGGANLRLAWVYAAARVAHSLVHALVNIVTIRFLLFAVASAILLALKIRAALVVFF